MGDPSSCIAAWGTLERILARHLVGLTYGLGRDGINRSGEEGASTGHKNLGNLANSI